MCVCVYFRTWTNLIEIRLVLNVTGSWNEPRAEIYPFATHGVSRACLAKLRNWPGNIASLISGAPRETCNLLRNSHALHVHLQHVWVVRLQEKVSSCADWEGFMVSILISVVTTLRFGTIQTIEYDPYRNARICLVKYEAGMHFVSGFNKYNELMTL
jgi:hypothetical protein